MLKISDLVGVNQQAIFTADMVERVMSNTQKMMEEGFLVPEPIALYQKGFTAMEHAYIVRRGPGPYEWDTNNTLKTRLLRQKGERIFITRGESRSGAFFKSAATNLSRNFPRSRRITLWGVSNLPTDSSDRISHNIFQVMEALFYES